MILDRRHFLLAGTAALAASGRAFADTAPTMMVYKSPTCGCCGAWIDHVRETGMQVAVQNMDDITIAKTRLGVPQELWSCHTALVGDYVVEGHVPVSDIQRLLAERPDVRGIAVPGMPAGSPGMEVPGYSEPYVVYAFTESGHSEFSRHGG